ncbi:MAG: hypothetical protein PHS32_01130 [Rhodoferax sp.]|uniref:hypothetical protein n=1 Tax=Rhodoferax sp. TaxID=50421 RepID=UPI00262725C3|nr:hypothetical protein [Rhodoferax sp.]MDD5332321.1 hypothetical protein [Rhodoferax sp.]
MTTPKQVNEPMPAYGKIPTLTDADIEGSLKALRRAAVRARQLALQTGTDLIVMRSGQVVRASPQQKTTS